MTRLLILACVAALFSSCHIHLDANSRVLYRTHIFERLYKNSPNPPLPRTHSPRYNKSRLNSGNRLNSTAGPGKPSIRNNLVSVSPPGIKPRSGEYEIGSHRPFVVHLQSFSNGAGSIECGNDGCLGRARPADPGVIRCTLDGTTPDASSNPCEEMTFFPTWEPCRKIVIKAIRFVHNKTSELVTFEYLLKTKKFR